MEIFLLLENNLIVVSLKCLWILDAVLTKKFGVGLLECLPNSLRYNLRLC